MPCFPEDGFFGTFFHYIAFVQDSHPFGNFGYYAQVVGNENNAYLLLLLQLFDECQDCFLYRYVQSRRGFVAN